MMMYININLLPWREHKKTREIRQLTYYFVAVLLSTIIVGLVIDGYLNYLIHKKTVLYQQLVKQNHRIDQTIRRMNEEKDRWIKRKCKNKSVYKLYSNRDLTTRVIKLLQQNMTLDVVINRIELHQNEITIFCSAGLSRLRHALRNNSSVLLLNQTNQCHKNQCNIRFKLR